MKKITVLCLLMSIIAFNWSCNKEKLTEFDIDYSTSLPVPASSYTVNTPVEFLTPEIPTESASKFSSAKTSQNLIDEIKMTRFYITAVTGNLDGLKNISIYLKTSNLGDVLVASKASIPAGSTSISADLNDVNIKEYIFKDKIQFRVSVTISSDPSAARQFKLDQTLHVKAKLIK